MSQEPRVEGLLARVTQRCKAFRKSLSGFGMIEAALLLPIFLGITFAMIDYGLLLTNRMIATSGASGIVRSIQDNPTMSAAQLNALVAGAGSGFVNFNAVGNCFCTQTFTTQAAADTFAADRTCTSCPLVTTSATKPHFLAMKAVITYRFITPVSKFFTSGGTTKVMGIGQVVRIGDDQGGGGYVRADAGCWFPNPATGACSCPATHTIQVPVDVTSHAGWVSEVWQCRNSGVGGYTISDHGCRTVNSTTGSCSCPVGTAATPTGANSHAGYVVSSWECR